MNSKGTGLTLALGIVIGFIGYILWQITIGPNTKSDDITTVTDVLHLADTSPLSKKKKPNQ